MIISLKEVKETGAKLPSQFQIGDFIQCNLDSYHGDGEQWIAGYIYAIKYTKSKVFYDLAVQIGNSDNCLIIENLRCFMRRVDDMETTNFIDVSKINLDDERLE